MTTGIRRLITHDRSASRMTNEEFQTVWSALSPAARATLEKLGHGRGISADEARRLAAELRRQGAGARDLQHRGGGGQGEPGAGDAAAEARREAARDMWRGIYRRAGVPVKNPDAADDAPARSSGSSLESWKRVYRTLGCLKPEEDV